MIQNFFVALFLGLVAALSGCANCDVSSGGDGYYHEPTPPAVRVRVRLPMPDLSDLEDDTYGDPRGRQVRERQIQRTRDISAVDRTQVSPRDNTVDSTPRSRMIESRRGAAAAADRGSSGMRNFNQESGPKTGATGIKLQGRSPPPAATPSPPPAGGKGLRGVKGR